MDLDDSSCIHCKGMADRTYFSTAVDLKSSGKSWCSSVKLRWNDMTFVVLTPSLILRTFSPGSCQTRRWLHVRDAPRRERGENCLALGWKECKLYQTTMNKYSNILHIKIIGWPFPTSNNIVWIHVMTEIVISAIGSLVFVSLKNGNCRHFLS